MQSAESVSNETRWQSGNEGLPYRRQESAQGGSRGATIVGIIEWRSECARHRNILGKMDVPYRTTWIPAASSRWTRRRRGGFEALSEPRRALQATARGDENRTVHPRIAVDDSDGMAPFRRHKSFFPGKALSVEMTRMGSMDIDNLEDLQPMPLVAEAGLSDSDFA